MNAPVTTGTMAAWAVDAMGGPLLERLVYFARFGPGLVLVSGESGVSSRELCGALAARLDQVTPLPATEVAGYLAAADHQTINEWSTLLVPDADTLSDAALADLRSQCSATTRNRLHVVLFGTEAMSGRLPDVHHERVPGLNEVSARTLLRRHLPGWAVSAEEVERTLRRTGGSQSATAEAFSQAFETQRPRIGLPFAHMAGLVAIAATIVALLVGLPRGADSPVNLPVGIAAPAKAGLAQPAPAEPVQAESRWSESGRALNTGTALELPPPSDANNASLSDVPASPARRAEHSRASEGHERAVRLATGNPQFGQARSVRLPESGALVSAPTALRSRDDQAGMWSLQLLVLSDPEQARRFVRSRADPGRYELIAAQGKTLILYGRYADKETARDSVASLPADLRELGPWPRLVDRDAEPG